MSPHDSDRRHFERQLVYARPLIILLALLALFEAPRTADSKRCISFLIAYLVVSFLVILLQRMLRARYWYLPLGCDLLALAIFVYISPYSVPLWFPYLFVCYAAGVRWGDRAVVPLAGLLSLSIVLKTVLQGELHWMQVLSWLAVTSATFAAGAGIGLLGDRNRRFAVQNEFFSRITATMQVDQGLAESLRLLMEEVARAFDASEALLAFRDADLERIFLWRLKSGESERLIPENVPLARADGFLLDDLDATICWNSLAGSGSGFGWDRRDGRKLSSLPRLPGPTQQELQMRSMMSVAFDQGGQPAGRIFLINGRRPFSRNDLSWFERIARHASPSLENLFLLRHLRARAIEAERSR